MKTPFGIRRTACAFFAFPLFILAAGAAEVTFTFYRFTATELRDDLDANSIQLSEFEFARGTNVVDLSGATITNPDGDNPPGEEVDNISDQSTGTKWLDFNRGPLVFGFPVPTTIDRYRFATANDSEDRDPTRWKLEGSSNGTSWQVIDQRDSETVPIARQTYTASFVLPAAPVITILDFSSAYAVIFNGGDTSLQWDVLGADSRAIDQGVGSVTPVGNQTVSPPASSDSTYTLTAVNGLTTLTRSLTIRTVEGGTSSYRYVRFSPRKLRNNGAANSIQLAEFRFFLAATQIPVAAVTNPGGNNPPSESPPNVIDGNLFSKWLDFNKGNLVFDFGTTVAFDRYEFTTAEDASERDPVRWIMEGSADGISWTLIENLTAFDFPTPTARTAATQVIPLPGPSLIALPPAPPPSITASALNFGEAGVLTLTFTSHESRTYRVTASDDLVDWSTVLEAGIPGAAGQGSTTVSTSFTLSTRGFFRVEEQ